MRQCYCSTEMEKKQWRISESRPFGWRILSATGSWSLAFDHALEAAITGAKGKNAKAIRALLDVDTLKGSKNQEADIKAALEGLKKDSGYLFDDGQIPPPYAGGTGTHKQQPNGEPSSLAGALRAKYNMT